MVATSSEELPRLDELYSRGITNGLDGIRFLKPDQISEYEPYSQGLKGLFVPHTGIVDYKSVALKYAEKLLQMCAEIIYSEIVVDIIKSNNKVEVISDSQIWSASVVVVCAGLQSDRLALKTERDLPIRILLFRGEYY